MPITYTLLDGADGKFAIDGDQVVVAGELPGGNETITVRASDENGWSKDFDFVIPVAFVLKALTLSNASFSPADPAGTVIGAIQNRSAGSTLSITPSDSQLAIDGSGSLVVGLTSSSPGTINAVIRETLSGAVGSPRDTPIAISVAYGNPVNVVPPAISGGFISGQTLSVSTGTWNGGLAPIPINGRQTEQISPGRLQQPIC